MNRAKFKILLLVVILGGLIALFKWSPLAEWVSKESLLGFFEQVKGEWWGPLVFILIYGIGCVVAIPGSGECCRQEISYRQTRTVSRSDPDRQ